MPEKEARPPAQNRHGGAPRVTSATTEDLRLSALRSPLVGVNGTEESKTRAQQRAAGTKKTALFDMVNRKRRGAMHRPMARTPSRQRQRTRDSTRGRASARLPPIASVPRSRYIGSGVAIAGRVSHARGTAEYRRRDQAVGRAAEEASLTSTRRVRAWRS